MKQKKIGIIEDDPVLNRELEYYLNTHGLKAQVLPPESYTQSGILQSGCHLLLLDIGLPGTDGIQLCKELRQASDLPVIMLTSQNTEMTELLSIMSGADDFVSKPFSPQILLARIEALLKRTYRENSREQAVTFGALRFDPARGRISGPEGEAELTRNELIILQHLISGKGEIVSRDTLINALWDDRQFVDDNTLTVNVTRIKGKLEQVGIHNAIATKRGMGYQLL